MKWQKCGCPAYIADPEVVDELQPAARYTGIPEIERISIFHALNSKAVSVNMPLPSESIMKN